MNWKQTLTSSGCILLAMLHTHAQQNDQQLSAFRDSAKKYEALNKNLQAYNFTIKAHEIISARGNDKELLARTESDLGTFAYRMGNIALSEQHHRRALALAQSLKKPSYECLYLSGNNMGSIMWFASRMDSALYYFNMAINAVTELDSSAQNKYYRPAVLYNNLAGIYGVQGKTTEAIASMKKTISYLKSFLAVSDSSIRKDNAMHFQFEATDNLAGIYKELGDYSKAHNLLIHSYLQKKKTLGTTDPDVFKSEVLLGQLYYAMKEFSKAEAFLNRGIQGFESADGDYLFWKADAFSTLAVLHGDTDRGKQAALYFEKADSLYEESLAGEYDNIYLQFLRDASVFYAQNGNAATALNKALKGYRYISRTEGEKSLSGFYQVLNLSQVYFELKDYPQAHRRSQQALGILDELMHNRKSLLDSIKFELKKPSAILLQTRSAYNMSTSRSTVQLQSFLSDLRTALSILERRKSVLQSADDINLMIADHRELISFMEQITAELYRTTGNSVYIDELVSLHESGIYNRIRSRLNQDSAIRFTGIPSDIHQQEQAAKLLLNTALSTPGSHDEKMQNYLAAEKRREQLIDQIREKYPEYYKMRYATIFSPLNEAMARIPDSTTAIRYMFAGKRLYALVADRHEKNLIELHTENLSGDIEALTQNMSNPAKCGILLNRLYNRLWAPLIDYISHRKILIIPDGVLFNLNFEILSPQKISSFADLATQSILKNYTVSYNYSLFLINPPKQKSLSNNFIAFTPGFLDQTKDSYKTMADTSIEVDHFYLSLLPQPFMVRLAEKYAGFFDGELFTGGHSTVSAFRRNASGHRIIHIGTHAEANNLNPQFSRLIFSKEESGDNNLYLFDIYNCDLRANLAVITACESGKVGYEDGEGLVSLAHAFNYAGSESMLTGLWKIDEKGCAAILQSFYDHLAEGMAKDAALREAKLDYLREHDGRALAPQYWAGLTIMGDVAPLSIKKKVSYWWLAGIGAMAVVVAFGFRRIRSRSSDSGS